MLHPEHTQDVQNDALFLKVNKAIYGHKDAGFDFYVYLSSYLLSRGYGRSESDPILVIQFLSWDNLIYIATWVDDLFVVGPGALFDEFSDVLRVNFTNLTCSNSDAITFLVEQHSSCIGYIYYFVLLLFYSPLHCIHFPLSHFRR